MLERMKELIADQLGIDADTITENSRFKEDLGADSVDLVELVMAMEEEFEVGEVGEEDLGSLKSVGDAVNFIAGKLK